MYISWIASHLPPLENLQSNYDGLSLFLEFDKQVNLLVGPNASGKSTILRAIKGMIHWSEHGGELVEDEDIWPIYSTGETLIGVDYESPKGMEYRPNSLKEDLWYALPFLYMPATRVSLSRSSKDPVIDNPLEQLFRTDAGIFYGQFVESAMDWLRQKLTPVRHTSEETVTRRKQDQFVKAVELGYSCTKSICSEVIHDDVVHPYVEINEDGNNPPQKIVHYNLGIGTTDDIADGPLYAGDLSSGTQGTLLWIWALVLKIGHHYDWQAGWEKQPAILLIDEIENHLHPTWQRRVIPALLEHFPGLQIFATTHSPFVVAGLKAGQVHLLNRDENGRVTATTNTEDVIGWTADEILRTMMGVDDPTDAATAAAARELRQLRQEPPRDTPEDEERRQQRIAELRQKVDRDLLAGGPMKARREEFERQFAEALEKRLQSQNLNQENG